MNFQELVKHLDGFVEKHKIPSSVRIDLLDLVQKAVDHGEAKEQNKIVGIAVKALKTLMGGSKSD